MRIASVKGHINFKDFGPYPIKKYQMVQPLGYGRIAILKSQYFWIKWVYKPLVGLISSTINYIRIIFLYEISLLIKIYNFR